MVYTVIDVFKDFTELVLGKKFTISNVRIQNDLVSFKICYVMDEDVKKKFQKYLDLRNKVCSILGKLEDFSLDVFDRECKGLSYKVSIRCKEQNFIKVFIYNVDILKLLIKKLQNVEKDEFINFINFLYCNKIEYGQVFTYVSTSLTKFINEMRQDEKIVKKIGNFEIEVLYTSVNDKVCLFVKFNIVNNVKPIWQKFTDFGEELDEEIYKHIDLDPVVTTYLLWALNKQHIYMYAVSGVGKSTSIIKYILQSLDKSIIYTTCYRGRIETPPILNNFYMIHYPELINLHNVDLLNKILEHVEKENVKVIIIDSIEKILPGLGNELRSFLNKVINKVGIVLISTEPIQILEKYVDEELLSRFKVVEIFKKFNISDVYHIVKLFNFSKYSRKSIEKILEVTNGLPRRVTQLLRFCRSIGDDLDEALSKLLETSGILHA